MKERYSVEKSLAFLQKKVKNSPRIGIVLGSGLSSIGDLFPGISIPYADIPGMPKPTVAGHRGTLKVSQDVAFFLGRFHFYEGYPLRTVAFLIFLMKQWGIKTVILTNAAGGMNKTYSPGQLVLIRDHLNFMGGNPLIGPHNPKYGPRFFDMTHAYTPSLREKAKKIAQDLGIPIEEGVYAAVCGPSYETPAEVRFFHMVGADLVGMSTVPEAIAAKSCGLDLLAISCVTNLAAGFSENPIHHEEVMSVGKNAESSLCVLLTHLIHAL